MKIINFLLLAFLLAVSVACNKDDDAPCTDLADTIVGSWSVIALGIDMGDVEFKSDGTLIDPDGALIDAVAGGVVLDEKSYNVNGNVAFTATAEKGDNSVELEYDVISIECDEIDISMFGFAATMKRN